MRRLISLILTVAIVVTGIPIGSFADEAIGTTNEVIAGKQDPQIVGATKVVDTDTDKAKGKSKGKSKDTCVLCDEIISFFDRKFKPTSL